MVKKERTKVKNYISAVIEPLIHTVDAYPSTLPFDHKVPGMYYSVIKSPDYFLIENGHFLHTQLTR
jgi:hypothetical protein